MGLFSSAWGDNMKDAKGVKTARQAKAHADKENNPSIFKQRKKAAKQGRGKGKR